MRRNQDRKALWRTTCACVGGWRGKVGAEAGSDLQGPYPPPLKPPSPTASRIYTPQLITKPSLPRDEGTRDVSSASSSQCDF